MAERLSKRPKITRGEDDYLPGNITEIELHNFMTFNHMKCKPGSRLNLVIGPNGSGKSSIVCAICLGLGGDPQILGRAGSIGAYVKRGEESGFIKIILRGESGDEQISITRKIDTSNKSEWLLNGKTVAKKDVIELVQRFNIQVNNLTQFLPQDKVCEFAKLSPVELLRATENAIGDPQLPKQHDALIEKSSQLGRLQRAVDGNKVTLSQLKAQHAEQERDVERVRQREDLLAQVDLMKKKLPWLEFDKKKAEYKVAKDKVAEAKKKYNEAIEILQKLKEPVKKLKEEKALHDSKCKKIRNTLANNSQRRKQLLENENIWGVEVEGKYKSMEDLKEQEVSRREKYLRAKEDLEAAELELAKLPPFESPKDEFEKLHAKIVELGDSAREIRHEKSEKENLLRPKRMQHEQLVSRIKSMENRSYKLLHELQKTGADKITEAYNWLQEHRNQLNRDVYGPVLLEVTVKEQSHADYLGGQVPFYIWKSFITQDPGDRDFLVKHMKAFDVPILNYVPNKEQSRSPPQISEEMRKLGISARLDQIFDAPAAVREVLISQSSLDHSYIGSTETDHRADEVEKLGILDFWTPANHYSWSRSRYGHHVSASVVPVSGFRLLSCSSDNSEIDNLRSRKTELERTINEIDRTLKSLQSELFKIENEESKYRKAREDLLDKVNLEKKRRKDMENRIYQKRTRLQSMEVDGDVDTQIARLAEEAADLIVKRLYNTIEIKNLLVDALSHKWSFAEKRLSSTEIELKIKESEMEFKEKEAIALQATMHEQNCNKEMERCRVQLSEAKNYAESIVEMTPQIREAFLKMPATIEDLEAAIQDNLAQASSILLLNQNVLIEYESRQKKIEALSKTLQEEEHGLATLLAEIDALKASWLPTLRNLVSQINGTFGHNFQEMAVAGEVSLDEHDMDFGTYGIVIKVKFRVNLDDKCRYHARNLNLLLKQLHCQVLSAWQAGQLQVLSAHHQSGGERSVSTILYLVSLQDLTHCPFRVVDEINQGMDPINERKMFQQLVRAASQPNTPQCFLLTPKLLPDLKYSEACSILNIMNGPWIEEPSKIWSNGESWGTVVGKLGQAQC